MRNVLLAFSFLFASVFVSAQSVNSVTLPPSACQGDTIVMTFSITSPYNLGNTFYVEMSDTAGSFTPSTIVSNVTPLNTVSTGNTIDVYVPNNAIQGAYKFRLRSSQNGVETVISNIVIAGNPVASITAVNYFQLFPGGPLLFCEGDTAMLVANQPPLGQAYDYQWLEGGAAMAGETNDTLYVTTSGAYSIEIGQGLCDTRLNDTLVNSFDPYAEIAVSPGMGITFLSNDSIQMCVGTVATLGVTSLAPPGPTYTYQWIKTDSVDIFGNTVTYAVPGATNQTLDVSTTGMVYLEVTSQPGGCLDTTEGIFVQVDSIPNTKVEIKAWNWQTFPTNTLCLTDSVLLTSTDTVIGTWDYQWQVAYPSGSGNWLNLVNDTMPWMVVDTSIIADTADYRLVIDNGTCNFFTNDTTIGFVNFPTLSILPGDSLGFCAYDSILVSLGGNGLSFSWNNGQYVGKQNFITTVGQYVIEASGVNNCKTYDTLDVYNFPLAAAATASPTIISPGESTLLSASGGSMYYWFASSPSTFSNQHGANSFAIPTADTTTYYVQVQNMNGCTDTASVVVIVDEQDSTIINAEIYGNLQNVITPNGDGMNDVLDLYEIMNGDPCEFSVYTRWGTPVYHQEVYNNAWGGTTDGGNQLEDGTYYFILTHDNKIRVKAAITVLNNF